MRKYEKWFEDNTHLLTNQLAIVVGATGTTGRVIVDYLLALKAKVIIAARNVNKAESFKKQMILKQVGLFTLDIIAISLTSPSSIPMAASFLGITPLIHPRSNIRLCKGSQLTALDSKIFPLKNASFKAA